MNQGQISKPYRPQENSNLPDPIMLARQIDGLREVVLRMRSAQSASIDALINQKLQRISES